jgi:hypothetical protein
MTDTDATIADIHRAFGNNEYPGDDYLLDSGEGSEPFDMVNPFKDRRDWTTIDAAFLDAHYAALSFFSEAGFRFYLPAYLVADIRRELKRADPLFPLTHGFSDTTIDVPAGSRTFRRVIGRSSLINPRRYGAMTFHDRARFRLSVFTREEATTIVDYLRYRRDIEEIDTAVIDAALDSYWLERTRTAPAAADLTRHLVAEDEFFNALRGSDRGPTEL